MKKYLMRAVALLLGSWFLLTACAPVIEESSSLYEEESSSEEGSTIHETDPEVTVEGANGMYTVTVDGTVVTVDTKYYPGWTRKAITFSLDDGSDYFDPLLIAILNEYGMRASFMLPRSTEYDVTLYAGHEIGNHTNSHSQQFMTTNANPYTLSKILADIDKQDTRLEGFIAAAKKLNPALDLNDTMASFAIPMTSGYIFDADGSADSTTISLSDPDKQKTDARSTEDNETLAEMFLAAGIEDYDARTIADLTNKEVMDLYFEAKGYVASRVIRNGAPVSYVLPEDFLFWTPSARLSQMADKDNDPDNGYQNDLSADFIDLADDGEMKLLYIWGHPSEVIHTATKDEHTGTKNETVWKRDLISFLALFQGDEYYKGTMSEIASYVNAQKALRIDEKGALVNASEVDLYAVVTVGDQKHEIRIPAGQSVKIAPLSVSVIARYYQNKKAAVSLTFDDGQIETGEYASETLPQYGLSGTMFLIIDKANAAQLPDEGTPEYEEWLARWQAVVDQGVIDIGNHSYHHYGNTLYAKGSSNVKGENFESQIDASRDKLALYFPNANVLSFATPGGGFCDATRNALISAGYLSNRVIGENKGINDPYSEDFDMMCVSSRQIVKTSNLGEINRQIDTTIEKGGWYVELYHYIDDENGNPVWDYNDSIKNYSVTRKFCEDHFTYLASKSDDVWYANYNDAVAYLIEAKYTYFALSDFSDVRYTYSAYTAKELLFRDYGLRELPEGYDHPLTVRFAVPADFTHVRVVQGENEVTLTTVKDGANTYVWADVIPTLGDIHIYRVDS